MVKCTWLMRSLCAQYGSLILQSRCIGSSRKPSMLQVYYSFLRYSICMPVLDG